MKKMRGFTLIEVMVAVAIVAIIASIGYPSYLDHVRKSRRAEAQSTLMSIASRQQQMILDTRRYADTVSALNIAVPTSVSQNYTISISLGSATIPSFIVQATPLGAQRSDSCGPLSISQAGVKTPTNCW